MTEKIYAPIRAVKAKRFKIAIPQAYKQTSGNMYNEYIVLKDIDKGKHIIVSAQVFKSRWKEV